jgi:hypothetical protein
VSKEADARLGELYMYVCAGPCDRRGWTKDMTRWTPRQSRSCTCTMDTKMQRGDSQAGRQLVQYRTCTRSVKGKRVKGKRSVRSPILLESTREGPLNRSLPPTVVHATQRPGMTLSSTSSTRGEAIRLPTVLVQYVPEVLGFTVHSRVISFLF